MIADMACVAALLLAYLGWLVLRYREESERLDVLIWTALNHDD